MICINYSEKGRRGVDFVFQVRVELGCSCIGRNKRSITTEEGWKRWRKGENNFCDNIKITMSYSWQEWHFLKGYGLIWDENVKIIILIYLAWVTTLLFTAWEISDGVECMSTSQTTFITHWCRQTRKQVIPLKLLLHLCLIDNTTNTCGGVLHTAREA